MNALFSETHAAWLAAQFINSFLLFPTLAAVVATALWYLKAGRAPSQRRAICWVLVILSGLLFAFLAAAVTKQGALVQFDTALTQALAMSVPTGLLAWLAYFTRLGGRSLLVIFAACIMLILLYRRYWLLAAGWVAAIAGSSVLNWGLKQAFQRVRPEQLHGYVTVQGWSFPSGHASAAMAFYGMLCYLVLRGVTAPWRGLCLFAAVWLITAIGLSRVILQVHYLSDVVAGFAVTFVWLAVCAAVMERALHRQAAVI